MLQHYMVMSVLDILETTVVSPDISEMLFSVLVLVLKLRVSVLVWVLKTQVFVLVLKE